MISSAPAETRKPLSAATPFVASIQRLFATMLKIPVSVGAPIPKTGSASTADVSAVIGFSGMTVGSIVLALPRAVSTRLVGAFVGVPIAFGAPHFSDAIGELLNIIAGGARQSFGADTFMTVPNVVLGEGHSFSLLSDAPTTVIPCTTADGNFVLEITGRHPA